jgi:hypothetical protein
MAKKYGFFNMLHDVFFNGNQVSDEFKDKPEKKEGRESWGVSERIRALIGHR